MGKTSRVYAVYGALFFPFAFLVAHPRAARLGGELIHAIGWTASIALILLAGSTNRVAIDLATGEVRTLRGLFGVGRRRTFVRPQIDGIFVTVHEDPRHPGRNYCAVGLQMGLLRYAVYRTMNDERAVAFYRDLKAVTGFPGVEGF